MSSTIRLLTWYLQAYAFVVIYRLRSEITLPVMRELVPHYLQDAGRVCVTFMSYLFSLCLGSVNLRVCLDAVKGRGREGLLKAFLSFENFI